MLSTKLRLITAVAVSAVMIVGVIVVCILMWNVDSLVYLCSLLAASLATGLVSSFLFTWAYRDKFDNVDPIDPAGTHR